MSIIHCARDLHCKLATYQQRLFGKIKRMLSFFIKSDEEARHRQSESRPYTSLLFGLKERYNLLPVCTVIGNAGGSCQVISSTTVV